VISSGPMAGSGSPRPVRVRVAPSPTGDPHVGTAYIALFNQAFAKQSGGTFVLRIEDTDQARARADSEQMIFDALRWVGLSWDEGPDVGGPFGPYRQSERGPIYAKHAELLLANGTAYRCFCTPERLAELKVQQDAAKKKGYDRRCRDLAPEVIADHLALLHPYTVRLAAPLTGAITVHDRLRGDITIDAEQVDDQVLIKSDGLPTYHLANVVDDHLMQITHVVRAEEWISSTPKHVLLYQAFGWDEPEWLHMPLLRNKDKSKISKRKNPVSINYYRDIGILPQALLNFLALMGWSFGEDREKFTLAEMIEVFSWDRISLGGPVFDLDKLTWLNEKYIHDLDDDQLIDALFAWRLNRDYLRKVLPLVHKRVKKLGEVVPIAEYFFSGELDHAAVLAEMTIPEVANTDIAKALQAYVERFEAREGFDAAMLEAEARAWCDALGWKSGNAFMLLRLAVTGRKASPPLFETMAVLGKELTRQRLRTAAKLIASRK
jgi:glutamyl-tRNA synthetase